MNRIPACRRQAGFTLIEVIVMLVVLSVLAGMTGMLLYSSYTETARGVEKSQDELAVVSTMERIMAKYRQYASDDEASAANKLKALINAGAFGQDSDKPLYRETAVTLPNTAGKTGTLLFVTVRRGALELTHVFN